MVAGERPGSAGTAQGGGVTVARVDGARGSDAEPRRLVGRHVVILLENMPYPQDRRVRLESEALLGAGARVTVLAPAGSGQADRERIEGVDVQRFPRGVEARSSFGYVREYGSAFVHFARLLAAVRRDAPIDVLHACTPPDVFFPLAWWARRKGARFVFDHHDASPELYLDKGGSSLSPAYWALRVAEWCSYRAADAVVASSAPLAQFARERGGVEASRVFLVRTGINESRLAVRSSPPRPASSSGAVVGFLGGMARQDGLDYLMDAARIIRHERGRADVSWLLIGDGPERSRLEQETRALGLGEVVRFAGFVADEGQLDRLLADVEVCVTPDPVTSFNRSCMMAKVFDYLTAGRAQVAFPLPETQAIAGDAALFVEPNSAAALADGILSLVDNPVRRREMEESARRRARQCLWQDSVEQLLAAYGRALAPRQGPSKRPLPGLS